ncbi:hypothetical protein Droror1_Dr00020439, partial [Drosera rotundifolia]
MSLFRDSPSLVDLVKKRKCLNLLSSAVQEADPPTSGIAGSATTTIPKDKLTMGSRTPTVSTESRATLLRCAIVGEDRRVNLSLEFPEADSHLPAGSREVAQSMGSWLDQSEASPDRIFATNQKGKGVSDERPLILGRVFTLTPMEADISPSVVQ